MMKREKQHLLLLHLLLLLLGTASISKLDYEIERKTSSYYRGTPFLSEVISSLLLTNRMASSVVLPIYGNVYPRGFYYVPVKIGNPARPYFLDPDTGSDLTWLQCDAPCVHCTSVVTQLQIYGLRPGLFVSRAPHPPYKPSNDLIHFEDYLCASIKTERRRCESFEQCDYEVEYADGGSSLGVLLREVVPFNFTDGIKRSPRLAIGCGYNQFPGSSYHPLDGVLGLGKGKVSIVSQLSDQGYTRNVVGHCLGGKGGGYIFFGDDVYDPSRIVWTPMSRSHSKHYSPGLAQLSFGQKATGVKDLIVVFDSGSSYTYLASEAYQTLISLITRELQKTSLEDAVDDNTLPICWKGKEPFKSIRDVKNYFKPLSLSFGRGKSAAQFDIPLENYLIISTEGSVCLGILNGSEVGLRDYNIIGDISMQDKMVIYDNEKRRIGWGLSNCNGMPKAAS